MTTSEAAQETDPVVAALRESSRHRPPAATARLLNGLLAEGLRQDTLVFYMKRAVPAIPLKVLLDAQGWREIGPGPLTDDDIDEMLGPWWPSRNA